MACSSALRDDPRSTLLLREQAPSRTEAARPPGRSAPPHRIPHGPWLHRPLQQLPAGGEADSGTRSRADLLGHPYPIPTTLRCPEPLPPPFAKLPPPAAAVHRPNAAGWKRRREGGTRPPARAGRGPARRAPLPLLSVPCDGRSRAGGGLPPSGRFVLGWEVRCGQSRPLRAAGDAGQGGRVASPSVGRRQRDCSVFCAMVGDKFCSRRCLRPPEREVTRFMW